MNSGAREVLERICTQFGVESGQVTRVYKVLRAVNGQGVKQSTSRSKRRMGQDARTTKGTIWRVYSYENNAPKPKRRFGRKREEVEARWAWWWYLHKVYGYTYAQVAVREGFDRQTVYHGFDNIHLIEEKIKDLWS